MKKFLQITAVAVLLCTSQTAFSQEKNPASKKNIFNISGKSSSRNLNEKTIVYHDEVSFTSENITFDHADKVVMYENLGTLKIYNCKNLKIINVKTLEKPAKKENDYITYNYKENTLVL
ncbi:MAG: hypothetical protein EOO19_07485 [Chryseobacterium sp.]|nr:MAG: hypothetical protein EOO19_07485 [Chryseobacterium sp.]